MNLVPFLCNNCAEGCNAEPSMPAPYYTILWLHILNAQKNWIKDNIYMDAEKSLAPFFCNNCAEG